MLKKIILLFFICFIYKSNVFALQRDSCSFSYDNKGCVFIDEDGSGSTMEKMNCIWCGARKKTEQEIHRIITTENGCGKQEIFVAIGILICILLRFDKLFANSLEPFQRIV